MTTTESEAARILVVDDEKVIREILAEFLTLEGYQVSSVEDGQKALEELRLRPYDLVISDLKMPRVSGLQLLEKLAEENINVLTVIMTGFGTVETAIEAMKRGAYDYILKPFKVEEVIHVVQRGLYRQQLQAENIRLREALTIYQVSEALATSLDLDHILDTILKAALAETDADAATLHLRDIRTGKYEERVKLVSPTSSPSIPIPAFELLVERFDRGQPVVSHGDSANRFFVGASAPNGGELVSFLSVPLQVGAAVIGVLNTYSFTARSSTKGTARCSRCSDRARRARSTTRASTTTCACATTSYARRTRRSSRRSNRRWPASRRRSRRPTCTRAATASASRGTPRSSRVG